MRICISINDLPDGSFMLSEHFGANGRFVIYDTARESFTAQHCDPEFCRGACHCQIPALQPPTFDAVICRNIGARAFMLLQRRRIGVFQTEERCALTALEQLKRQQLHAVARGLCQPDASCDGDGY